MFDCLIELFDAFQRVAMQAECVHSYHSWAGDHIMIREDDEMVATATVAVSNNHHDHQVEYVKP